MKNTQHNPGIRAAAALSLGLALGTNLVYGEPHPHVTGGAFGTPVPISDGSPGPGRGLWLEDGRLYLLSRNELCLYSVEEDPLRPRLLGRAPGVFGGRQVVVGGGIAYVSARERGMWIVDCRVPDRMEVLCRYDSISLGTGVEVSGDVCMLTETRHGVEFIDVSDPRRPQHIRICKTDESQSVIFRDGFVYSGEWGAAHLTVLDARDMSAVREVARCDFHGNGDGIWKCGNFLYCATGRHAAHVPGMKRENRKGQGLDVIDVSDPARPRNVSRISYAPGFCRGKPDTWVLRASGSLLVSAQTCQGLYAVDVSDPANPTILDRWIAPDMHPVKGMSGTEDCPGGAVTSVAIGDGVVYAAGPDFVPVAIPCKMAKYEPVNRGKQPANAGWRDPYPDPPADFARWLPPPQFRGLARACAVVGDTCYAACSDAGLYALELGETGIVSAKKLGPGKAFDVAAGGDRLYVAEGSEGWAIYSVTGGGIEEIGRYRRDGELARDVYACTERWAVFSNRGRCHLMDVSDPSAPKYVLSAQNQAGWNKFMCPDLLGGRYLACNSALKYVEWIDLDAVPAPKLSIAADSLLSSSAGLCSLGGNALVCDSGRYAIVKPGADGPWNFREFDGGGIPRTDGRLVAQSLQNGGTIRLHDFSDPLCPKRLGEWRMKSSFAGPCSFWKGRIIVPCGYMGVLLQKTAYANPQFQAVSP